MKKLLLISVILTFVCAAPFSWCQAQDTKKEQPKHAPKVEKTIKCCINGECKEMTQAECTKEKGKKVSDCKKCKPKAEKPAKSDKKTSGENM